MILAFRRYGIGRYRYLRSEWPAAAMPTPSAERCPSQAENLEVS